MRGPRLTGFIFLLVAAAWSLQAQVARFRHISVDDGLSQNSVSSIAQDRKGFIWIGTYDGLNKFDGYKITKYTYAKDSNSMSSSYIRFIYPDDEDNLWLSTATDGLCRFHIPSGRFTHYRFDSTERNCIASNSVFEVNEYVKGKLYIATGKGLNIFDKKTETFTLIGHKPGDKNGLLTSHCRTMTRDRNGHIWVGHHGFGLTEYNPESNTFVWHTPGSPGFHLSDYKIRSIYADSRGLLWVSLWVHGVNVVDLKTGKVYYPNDSTGFLKDVPGLVSQFSEDSKGNMWLCSAEQGLVKFDLKTHEVTRFMNNPDDPETVSDNITFCAMEDRSGLIWSGTWKGGVNYFDPRSLDFGFFKHESNKTNTLNHNNVYSFYDTGHNNLLVGTGASVCYFNTASRTFAPFNGDPKDANGLPRNSVISDIIEYTDGSLWFTTGGSGAFRYFPKTKTFRNYITSPDPNSLSHHTPNCMLLDNNGRLWISTLGAGLNLYNDDKDNFTRFVKTADPHSLSDDYISCLAKDAAGNIWIGSSGAGFTKLDPNTKTFTRYFSETDNNPLPDLGISSIYAGPDGLLWLGCTGGLCSYNPVTKAVKNHALEHAVLKTEFYAISGDRKGNLWLTSDKGLIFYDPKAGVTKTFTKENGIQGKEFNPRAMYTLGDGRILAGGINGFNFFDPERISLDTVPPLVSLTGFAVLNKPGRLPEDIAYTKHITLSYRDYFFSFDVAALDFSNTQLNEFAYKLDNFNDDWVNIGKQHIITFTNLDPGDYLLNVKGSNSAGYWSKPLQLKITITPPFWRTTWFYLLCIIAGALLIYGYIKYREKKLITEKALLEKKVEERTEELNSEKQKVEEAHKDIKDSILYAQKIQSAVIPLEEDFRKAFRDSFVLFRPKDIVSGDFYWMSERPGYVFYAVADCTGHGVPGGFMTMLGSGLLNEIVNEHNITEPAEILDKLREKIITSLKQTGRSGENKDGMDIVLFRLKKDSGELCYAAANNGFIVVSGGAFTEHAGDKQPVGIYGDELKPFRQFELQLKAGDIIYSFTDGFPDQFGGPKGKKFKYRQLYETLMSRSQEPMGRQKELLNSSFETWKGGLEQVDDVCVIGVRI